MVLKIDETGDVAQKEGPGRPKSVRTEENIKLVEKIILSQDHQPGIHSTPAEITCELNIDRHLVLRIIDQDLDLHILRKRKMQKLTDSNIEKCMIRSGKLLAKYTQKTLQTAFFNDEKIFNVKQLYNSHNDVVFVPVDFGIWGLLEQNLYRGQRINDLDSLKEAIIEE